MPDVIKSYLVSLGFKVDEPSVRRFVTTLDEAQKAAIETTSGIAKEVLKWQTVIVGAFASLSAGIVALVDSTADADEQYRIFGERMMLTKDRAEITKRTLDAMHATMADLPLIMLDPERAKRYHDISEAIAASMAQRGPDFEQNMIKWRGLTTQLTILGNKVEDIKKSFSEEMMIRFGPQIETLLTKFIEWADYLTTHQKQISGWFADEFIPVLKGAYDGVKAMLIEFTNLVALFTNDKSLETTTVNFEKLARAMGKVLEMAVALGKMAGRTGAPGDIGDAGNLPVGAPHFGWMDKADAWIAGLFKGDPNATSGGTKGIPSGGGGDAASRAMALARQVGGRTGVDPRLIFEQWAFETGGFTSPAFRNLNNIGGFKIPHTNINQQFGSLEESADYYAKQIGRNYPGLATAHSERDFAAVLKAGRAGSYFGDLDPNIYSGGMAAMGQRFAGTISTNITVNVAQTDASALDISQAVDQAMQKQNRYILSRLQQGSM